MVMIRSGFHETLYSRSVFQSHGENITFRMVNNAGGGRTKQQAYAMTTMGAKHDQVGPDFFGNANDLCLRAAHIDELPILFNLQLPRQLLKALFCGIDHLVGKVNVERHDRTVAGISNGQILNNVKEAQIGPISSSQITSSTGRLPMMLRKVGSQQDLPIIFHGHISNLID
jgi:hypothetical protein